MTTTIRVNWGKSEGMDMPFRRIRRQGNVVYLGSSQWLRLTRLSKDIESLTCSIDGEPVQLKRKT